MNKDVAQRQMMAIKEALAVMADPGQILEVRLIGVDGRKNRVDSGYFDDFEQLARVIPSYTSRAEGIYITLNQINPALLARAANRIKTWSNLTTADGDVIRRCWLPIDIDPVRPAGISATDNEHEAALKKAIIIQAWLADWGWPSPVYADSGNGAHLLYRVDLPNTIESSLLIQRCLQAVAVANNDEQVQVDVGNYNAGRIWKLYYTLTAKGDSTPDRPHRWSQIITAETPIELVTFDQLQQLADTAPDELVEDMGTSSRKFDVDAWLEKYSIKAVKNPWKSGWCWRLNHCPFSDAHSDGAYIIQFPNGAISAGCHHNSCKGKTWRELRALFEGYESTDPPQDPDLKLRQLIRTEVTLLHRQFLATLRNELRTGFGSFPPP